MKTLYILSLSIFLLSNTSMFAQVCDSYEDKCVITQEDGFEKSRMSRSFELRKSKVKTLILPLYAGNEFFFSVCGKPKLGELQFRIKDAMTGKLIYDNSSDGFATTKLLEIKSTSKIKLEIIAPYYNSSTEALCAALYIASRKVVR